SRYRRLARLSTSARPPSESTDSSCLLAAWGPNVHLRTFLLLLGCPKFLARRRQLDGDSLHARNDLVERLLQPQVGAKALVATVFDEQALRLLDVVALLALIADELVDLLVGDLDRKLVRGCVEDELAGERLHGLVPEVRH